MLLNVAVGGNFGGAVGPDTTFPQQTLVDYVRLYQARPSPAKFAPRSRDDFTRLAAGHDPVLGLPGRRAVRRWI